MSNSDQGIIFNIRGYCIHDGPGIRTSVFLKGSNQPVQLVFDPLPISYIVKSAHRIRLTIVNANPGSAFLSPEGATVSIYRDALHASSISLPVIDDPIKVDVQNTGPG